MSSWDFINLGAVVKPENKCQIEKIFEYIGYGEPGYCETGYIADVDVKGSVFNIDDDGPGMNIDLEDEKNLLYLLNALYPGTSVLYIRSEGSNTTDSWETCQRYYDVSTMTMIEREETVDHGGDGENRQSGHKEMFKLKAPKLAYIEALLELSTKDGNAELTALILELIQNLKDGKVRYKKNPKDRRVIGRWYDAYDSEDDKDEDDRDEDDWDEDNDPE